MTTNLPETQKTTSSQAPFNPGVFDAVMALTPIAGRMSGPAMTTAPGDSTSTVHPAALNEADIDRMKRYGITETRAIVDLLGAIKREAYDAGRADVLKNGDGFHTFDDLYEARMLYHAAFVNAEEEIATLNDLPGPSVKSWRHSDGEKPFGGGWFIVVTTLPTGQISQHYPAEHWDLFQVPEVETPPEFDDHTTADVHARLRGWVAGSDEHQ